MDLLFYLEYIILRIIISLKMVIILKQFCETPKQRVWIDYAHWQTNGWPQPKMVSDKVVLYASKVSKLT